MKSPTSKHSKKKQQQQQQKKPTKKQNKTKQQQHQHQQQKMFRFACLLPLFFFNSIRMQIWRITWPTKVRCVRASLMGP